MTAPPAKTPYVVALEPQPGAYLSSDQSRRAFLLAVVLQLVAGRNVPIVTVWDMAMWLETGKRAEK